MSKAWAKLERRYCLHDMAIISSRYKLIKVQLRGHAHEQVEALLQAVRVTQASLHAVKAEDMMFGDYAAPVLLVAKLPASCQERWDMAMADCKNTQTPQELGRTFMAWLVKEGKTAVGLAVSS